VTAAPEERPRRLEELPNELIFSILGHLDAHSLHCLALASNSAMSEAARTDEFWEGWLNSVSVRPRPGIPAWRQFLDCRWSVYGPRFLLSACERGDLPFLSALGDSALPDMLTYGLVCDVVKQCASRVADAECKYRAAAAWIARRSKAPRDVDEKRLAAALREAYQRCFPPGKDAHLRQPRRGAKGKAAGAKGESQHELMLAERDMLAERLAQGAVRTTCVAKVEHKWLRHHATTF